MRAPRSPKTCLSVMLKRSANDSARMPATWPRLKRRQPNSIGCFLRTQCSRSYTCRWFYLLSSGIEETPPAVDLLVPHASMLILTICFACNMEHWSGTPVGLAQ